MSFNDFIHKYSLKNKATAKFKIYQVLSATGLSNVGIYLRDGPNSSDIGILNLHPSKGTHWVAYINEKFFDSCGFVCPKKLSMYVTESNGY